MGLHHNFEIRNDFRETFDEIANLTLYNTYVKFLYIKAIVSLAHYFLITVNHLDAIVEK